MDDYYSDASEYSEEICGGSEEDLIPEDISSDADGYISEELSTGDDFEDDEVNLKEVSSYNKELIVVDPENRQTSNRLTNFEQTEIISIRSVEISQFNNPMIDAAGMDDPTTIAKAELMARMCPLVLRRPVGEIKNEKTGLYESYVEDWNPNEMAFARIYLI